MKKIITLIFILVSISFANAQTKDALDYNNGFRGYKFGDPLEKFNNMASVDIMSDENKTCYQNVNDSLIFKGYQLSSINYIFYKKSLGGVIMYTKNLEDGRKLLKTLTDLYGPGFKPNDNIEQYSWWGQKVCLLYEENFENNTARIYMWSKTIQGL